MSLDKEKHIHQRLTTQTVTISSSEPKNVNGRQVWPYKGQVADRQWQSVLARLGIMKDGNDGMIASSCV